MPKLDFTPRGIMNPDTKRREPHFRNYWSITGDIGTDPKHPQNSGIHFLGRQWYDDGGNPISREEALKHPLLQRPAYKALKKQLSTDEGFEQFVLEHDPLRRRQEKLRKRLERAGGFICTSCGMGFENADEFTAHVLGHQASRINA